MGSVHVIEQYVLLQRFTVLLVGLFAIDEGLAKPVEPTTTVSIYNTNTDKMIYATVQVKDGRALSEGDYEVPGVPGTGARILLEFEDPSGSVTKKLLPTGNVKDVHRPRREGKVYRLNCRCG